MLNKKLPDSFIFHCQGALRIPLSHTIVFPSVYVTVHSIAANSNASRHLESSATMGEMHSGQNVHPHS